MSAHVYVKNVKGVKKNIKNLACFNICSYLCTRNH